jgi:hypothetical protein
MKNILIILVMFSTSAFSQNNNQLINWFAGGDLIGMANSQNELGSDFLIREFELSAFSQIDYIWQGSMTLAIHKEPASSHEAHTEIHEAFIFSNRVIPGTSVKMGRFFLGFGRLNRFHRHDWAISEAPEYHKEFFGDEAVIDDGIEISKILPFDRYYKLTAGITSGNRFKDEHEEHGDHEEGDKEEFKGARVPTHYLRLSSFVEFSTQRGFEYAFNYIGRTDEEGNRSQFTGIDLVYKNRSGRTVKDLFQLEIWNRETTEKGEEHAHQDQGGYLYYERGLNQNHGLGLKFDFFIPNEHDHEEESEHEHGYEIGQDYKEISLAYSYYSSEFMRTRLTISHASGIMIDEKSVENTKLVFQTVFMIGAHPAHLY